jgi:hypothetical protein
MKRHELKLSVLDVGVIRIVPLGPSLDLQRPLGRERLT